MIKIIAALLCMGGLVGVLLLIVRWKVRYEIRRLERHNEALRQDDEQTQRMIDQGMR
jgi:hypothetical protein